MKPCYNLAVLGQKNAQVLVKPARCLDRWVKFGATCMMAICGTSALAGPSYGESAKQARSYENSLPDATVAADAYLTNVIARPMPEFLGDTTPLTRYEIEVMPAEIDNDLSMANDTAILHTMSDISTESYGDAWSTGFSDSRVSWSPINGVAYWSYRSPIDASTPAPSIPPAVAIPLPGSLVGGALAATYAGVVAYRRMRRR